MGKLRNDQDGFAAMGLVLVLVIVVLLGVVGWFAYNNHKRTDNNNSAQATSTGPGVATQTSTTSSVKTDDSNAGYLVVKEWGLRFKVPAGIKDVKYAIRGDVAAFYAKPTGSSVQYRSDYDRFSDGTFQYATGVLYRSKDATNNDNGFPTDGKKIGNYYYYTAWSFSSLASGSACVEIYGSSSENNCKAEGAAFALVNGNDGNNEALLMTIQLVQ